MDAHQPEPAPFRSGPVHPDLAEYILAVVLELHKQREENPLTASNSIYVHVEVEPVSSGLADFEIVAAFISPACWREAEPQTVTVRDEETLFEAAGVEQFRQLTMCAELDGQGKMDFLFIQGASHFDILPSPMGFQLAPTPMLV